MYNPSLRRLREGDSKLLSRKHYKCKCSEGRVPVFFGKAPEGGPVIALCSRCDRPVGGLRFLPNKRSDYGE